MSKSLRALIVEDSPDDAELLTLELCRGGFDLQSKRVEDASAMQEALSGGAWDVVLADYSIPGFGAVPALALVREADPDIPFVVVSGTVGEDVAVDLMRQGANDFVLKSSTRRLVPAVERELREAENRRARRKAEQTAAHLAAVVMSSEDAIISESLDGTITTWNPAAERLYGWTAAEAVGRHISFLVPPDRTDELAGILALVVRGEKVEPFETVRLHRDGTRIDVALTLSPVRNPEGRVIGASKFVRDIRGRLRQEEALRTSEARFRGVFESELIGTFFWQESGQVPEANDAFLRLIGYSREDLLAGRVSWAEITPPEYRARDEAALGEYAAIGRVTPYEKEYIRKDGSRVPVLVGGVSVNGSGVAFALDITDRRQAEEALRQSEERFRTFMDHCPAAAFVKDVEGRYQYVNPAWLRQFDPEPADWVGKTDHDFWPPEAADTFRAGDRECLATGQSFQSEGTGQVRATRERKHWLVLKFPIGKGARRLVGGMAWDVTERRRAEQGVRESEGRLRAVIASMAEGLIIADAEGNLLTWNETALKLHGYTDVEEVRRSLASFADQYEMAEPGKPPLSPHDWPMARVLRGESFVGWELQVRQKETNRELVISYGGAPVSGAGGQVELAALTLHDVTEHRQAEEQLRESEGRYRELFEANPHPMWVYDTETLQFLAVNDAAVARYGYSLEEFLGMSILNIRPEADRSAPLGELSRPARELSLGGLWRHQWKDGTVREVEIASHALRYAGRPARLVLAVDVTERRRAETALRQSEGMLRAVLETLPVGVWVANPRGEIILDNRAGQQIWSGGRGASYQNNGEYKGWWADTGRKVEPHECGLTRALEKGETSSGEVINIECFDGSRKTILKASAPVCDPEGAVIGAVSVVEDVTERRALEEQFRQVQKMEAVGRLAGGIAHDFNNLLTVINGFSELLLRQISPGAPGRELVEGIYQAGERSAALTRQLLVFSRKQVVQPRVLDLNEVVSNAEKLLRRMLGEDVLLQTVPGRLPGRVRADPSHLEQVLMNLAVNARDAMPQGGRLTIETAEAELSEEYARLHTGVRPGIYILLAVSDTGTGMSDEVQARVFEPFFTTKEAGKGTGLGLSVVHGVVKEAGGHVAVYSEVGVGTTFKVYLPLVEEEKSASRKSRSGVLAPPRGTETILLVEDEDAVRALGRTVLVSCGYSVLEAADGTEALRLATAQDRPIHLLITDVVMPGGLGGRQLADRIVSLYPRTKVLYVSGYTDDAVVRHGVLEEHSHFLQKPFSPLTLARTVREILDLPTSPASATAP